MTHLALIGMATAATAVRKPPPPLKPIVVRLDPPPPPKPVKARVVSDDPRPKGPMPPLPRIDVRHIEIPTVVPDFIPPIDLNRGAPSDSFAIGSPRGGAQSGGGLGLFDLTEKPSSGEWRGSELLMRMTASGKPRYPEALRQSGIEGTVLI
ncbi:MAG: hypothetical protein ACREBE_12880, partial [bacterium]